MIIKSEDVQTRLLGISPSRQSALVQSIRREVEGMQPSMDTAKFLHLPEGVDIKAFYAAVTRACQAVVSYDDPKRRFVRRTAKDKNGVYVWRTE